MGDYFSLPNYLADVNPPTKKTEKLLQDLENMHTEVRNYNSSKANEKPILGKIMRYCPLDESPLKPIKSKPIEGLEINKPRYRCVLCKSVFEGFGTELYHESKRNLKAIAFEQSEVI